MESPRGSQSECRIRFILPARGCSHIINRSANNKHENWLWKGISGDLGLDEKTHGGFRCPVALMAYRKRNSPRFGHGMGNMLGK